MIIMYPSTWPKDRKLDRLNELVVPVPVPLLVRSPTVLFREVKTPRALSTFQTTAVPTMVTMPMAMDSTKETFMTDHGSTRATRSLALRTRACGETAPLLLPPGRLEVRDSWVALPMAAPTRAKERPAPVRARPTVSALPDRPLPGRRDSVASGAGASGLLPDAAGPGGTIGAEAGGDAEAGAGAEAGDGGGAAAAADPGAAVPGPGRTAVWASP